MSHFAFPMTERELSQLWQDQTFPAEALTTTAGERLRVVYRGRRTGGPGPDFRDALIAAPDGLLRGDVELHVRSGDFRRHGHHLDGAYADVVLHLVFADDEPGQTALPGGGRARVVALGAWVEGRAQEIERWLERPALWREPCFSAIGRQGPAAVAATLERLGDMRFRARVAAFAQNAANDEPESLLWRALLEALAFGGDRQAFQALSGRVPWAALRRELLARPLRERTAAARARLHGALEALPRTSHAVRPGNRREDRLSGAAALAARFAERGPVAHFARLLDHGDDGLSRVAKIETGELENGKESIRTPSRVSHFEFRASERDSAEKRSLAALLSALTVSGSIGRSRAIELLANAVLPSLAALGPEARARRAEALYRGLPLSARYGAVRHLHEALGGPAPPKTGNRKMENGSRGFRSSGLDRGRQAGAVGAPGVRPDFRRQQGMLYLLKQYCTQGGCGRCPLS